MRRTAKKRSVGKQAGPRPTAKRLREIQKVFDRLGIGDDAARRNARSVLGESAEPAMHYRIVLSGSTV